MTRSLTLALFFLSTVLAFAALTFEDGMRLKNAGQKEKAAAVFLRLVKKNPKDAQSSAQLAIVEGCLDHKEASRESYEVAQELAPENQDIEKKLTNAVDRKKWRADVGFIHDTYSKSRDPESSGYVQLGYTLESGTHLYFHYDNLNEFKKRDSVFLVGVASHLFSKLLLITELGYTPSPNFKPEFQSNSDLNFEVIPQVTLLLGYKYWNYEVKTVQTPGANLNTALQIYQPGLRLQFVPWLSLEGRYALTHNLDSSNTTAFRLIANFEVYDFAPYVSYAHGTEEIPPLARATVTYYSLGSVWNINPEWSARLDYTREDRLNVYVRNSIGVGLSYKF